MNDGFNWFVAILISGGIMLGIVIGVMLGPKTLVLAVIAAMVMLYSIKRFFVTPVPGSATSTSRSSPAQRNNQ